MKMKKAGTALAVLFLFAANMAVAEDWPVKPITLQLGYSAGGSSDIMCRILAKALGEELGQPVTVINKPGAGGWICWNDMFTNAPTDGHTFYLVNTPYINMGFYDPANPRKWKHTDADLLINQVVDYSIMAIRADEERFTDFPSFLEYAKNNPIMSAASAVGVLSDDFTCMQKLMNAHGIEIDVVQTSGAKETETYFLSGDSDVMFANIGDVRPAHEGGEYKAVVVFAPVRSELLPDVPTYKELGYGELIEYSARGYAYPKGVADPVRAKMIAALEKAILAVKPQMDTLGAETVVLKGDEYVKFLDEDVVTGKAAYNIK